MWLGTLNKRNSKPEPGWKWTKAWNRQTLVTIKKTGEFFQLCLATFSTVKMTAVAEAVTKIEFPAVAYSLLKECFVPMF